MSVRWLKERNWVMFAAIAGAVALMLLVNLVLSLPLPWKWAATMLVFALLISFVGKVRSIPPKETDPCPNGRWDAAFIDARRKISLSRFQLVLWTVIIFSAWGTVALHRIRPETPAVSWAEDNALAVFMCRLDAASVNGLSAGDCRAILAAQPGSDALTKDTGLAEALIARLTGIAPAEVAGEYEALNIIIPTDIWLLLGISTASLVGAGLIKVNKSVASSASPPVRALDGQIQNAGRKVDELEAKAGSLGESAAAARELARKAAADLKGAQGERDALLAPSAAAASPAAALATEAAAALAAVEVNIARLKQAQTSLEADYAAKQSAYLTAQAVAESARQELIGMVQERRENTVGSLQVNSSIAKARWTDLFAPEAAGSELLTDMGKVQMFLITIVLLVAYGALVWSQLAAPGAEQALRLLPVVSLPAVPDSMVALFGISHAGYLATKQMF